MFFYNVPVKETFKVRKEIFLTKGIPALQNNGFEKSPFSGTRFGKYDQNLYAYDFCRLSSSHLERITTYISRRDNFIQIYLNVFQLEPQLESIEQLKGLDGIQFFLIPNKLTEMRLRSDGVSGMPLFNTVKHKIKTFYTKTGYQKRVNNLSGLIEKDLGNINSFLKTWHELHSPLITNWEGKQIDK